MQTNDGYEFDDSPGRINLDAVWDFLSSQAYWHRWRARADVEKQVAGSWRVVGIYGPDGAMVGFARALSDGCALAYLSDVYVLAAHRGRGLGRQLLTTMIEDGPGAGFRWMLHTADAHGLYREFGFTEPNESYLERPGSNPPV